MDRRTVSGDGEMADVIGCEDWYCHAHGEVGDLTETDREQDA